MRAQERAVRTMIHDLDEMDRDMALLKKTMRLVPAISLR